MKFLVKTPGGLGDVAMAMPIFRAIVRNGHGVEVILRENNAGLLQDCDFIDAVHAKKHSGGFIEQCLLYGKLLKQHWDVVLNIDRAIIFELFSWLCIKSVRRSVRTQGDLSHLPKSHLFRRLAILEGIFDDWSDPVETSVYFKPERFDTACKSLGISNKSKYLTVAPGSSRAEKNWPLERFREVVSRTKRNYDQVIVVGSPSEKEKCDRLAEACGVKSAAGRISLIETVALVSNAFRYIGNDSGMGHVAAGNGTTTLAIGMRDHMHCPWKQACIPGFVEDITINQVLEALASDEASGVWRLNEMEE